MYKGLDFSKAYNLVFDKLDSWLKVAISMLPNLVIALITGIIFYVLARLIRKMVDKLLRKVTDNLAIIHLIESIAGIMVASIGLFIMLSILKLNNTVTTLLTGAGIIGLALGFAFQDIAANFISGVILSIRHQFRVSDVIKTNDFYGTVEKLNLRNTLIQTPQGQLVYIPNKMVFESPLINYSQTGLRRIDLEVGVSYGDDLEKVKKVAVEAVKKIDGLARGKTVELFYGAFGNSSINFTIRFWVPFRLIPDYLKIQSEAIILIKKAFDENDITIPFPIRTLDFGIKGGEKLDAMLHPLNDRNGAGNPKAIDS